jgi:hypothetical protein
VSFVLFVTFVLSSDKVKDRARAVAQVSPGVRAGTLLHAKEQGSSLPKGMIAAVRNAERRIARDRQRKIPGGGEP